MTLADHTQRMAVCLALRRREVDLDFRSPERKGEAILNEASTVNEGSKGQPGGPSSGLSRRCADRSPRRPSRGATDGWRPR
jgi:hypothetical protein